MARVTVLKDGKLNPEALSTIKFDKLSSESKHAVRAIIEKNDEGKKLTPKDLENIVLARRQSKGS